MIGFETIPASPKPEEPEDGKKEEETRIEAEDWDSDKPLEEPRFVTESEDVTRLSPHTPPPPHEEPDIIEPARQLPPVTTAPPPKKNRTWLIILIVALVLLCLCCVILVVIGMFVPSSSNFEWNLQDMLRVPSMLPI